MRELPSLVFCLVGERSRPGLGGLVNRDKLMESPGTQDETEVIVCPGSSEGLCLVLLRAGHAPPKPLTRARPGSVGPSGAQSGAAFDRRASRSDFSSQVLTGQDFVGTDRQCCVKNTDQRMAIKPCSPLCPGTQGASASLGLFNKQGGHPQFL